MRGSSASSSLSTPSLGITGNVIEEHLRELGLPAFNSLSRDHGGRVGANNPDRILALSTPSLGIT